jgi:hypothetical protein
MTLLDRMNANFKSEISISEMDAIEEFMRNLNKRPVEEVRKELELD